MMAGMLGTRRMRLGPLAASIALAAAAAVVWPEASPIARVEAARPGSIRGRVDLRRAPAPTERRPNVSDLGAPPVRDLPDLLRSVVYLESAPRGAFETAEGGHVIMDQRNETFVPHVLAIATGTTVDFPNSDKFYHNVFSLSKTRTFDLGRYAAGHSRPIRFDRA